MCSADGLGEKGGKDEKGRGGMSGPGGASNRRKCNKDG